VDSYVLKTSVHLVSKKSEAATIDALYETLQMFVAMTEASTRRSMLHKDRSLLAAVVDRASRERAEMHKMGPL